MKLFSPRRVDKDILRHLRSHLANYRTDFFLGFLFLAIANLCLAFIPLGMKLATDALQSSSHAELIYRLAASLFLLSLLHSYFRIKSRTHIYRIGRELEHDLRLRFHTHLLHLPPSFFTNEKTGDLVARGTADMTAVRMFIGPGFLQLATTTLIYAVTLPMMVWLNPLLTLLALSPLPIVLLLARLITARLYQKSALLVARFGTLSAFIQESVNGMSVIRDHAQEKNWLQQFDTQNQAFYQASLNHSRLQSLFAPLMTSAGGIGVFILLAHGGPQVANQTLTVGDFVAFSGYLTMLVWPTVGFGWILTVILRGLAAMERISVILDTPIDPVWSIPEPPFDSATQPQTAGAITIQHLTFGYRPDLAILKNISLHIPAGQFIGIVGRVGCGKSTLLATLARLYPVPEQTIFIDGHELNTIPEQQWRRLVAMTPQESYLFSTSLHENILFGNPTLEEAQVWQLAQQVCLEQEIISFPHQLATQVGERGITLSGGQRQRTAIARALAQKPTILLLDDIFSSVDARTENNILDNIRLMAPHSTILMVCHRVAALQKADRIVVMEEGTIVAQGSHAQLLASHPLYQSLHARMSQQEAMETLT